MRRLTQETLDLYQIQTSPESPYADAQYSSEDDDTPLAQLLLKEAKNLSDATIDTLEAPSPGTFCQTSKSPPPPPSTQQLLSSVAHSQTADSSHSVSPTNRTSIFIYMYIELMCKSKVIMQTNKQQK